MSAPMPTAVHVVTRASVSMVKHILRPATGRTYCGRDASLPLAELEDGARLLRLPTCKRCASLNSYPLVGELAEQRHWLDPLDHTLEHLADERPEVSRG